ncbi:hypothetical protein ACFLXD_06860 [Chloroflexota bacterium]
MKVVDVISAWRVGKRGHLDGRDDILERAFQAGQMLQEVCEELGKNNILNNTRK